MLHPLVYTNTNQWAHQWAVLVDEGEIGASYVDEVYALEVTLAVWKVVVMHASSSFLHVQYDNSVDIDMDCNYCELTR